MTQVEFKETFIKIPEQWQNNLAKQLVMQLRKTNSLKGKDYARLLKIPMQTIRTIIQIIRENPNHFLHRGEFIVANDNGYQLTNDKRLIKQWADKQHKRAVSGLKQVNEAWNAL